MAGTSGTESSDQSATVGSLRQLACDQKKILTAFFAIRILQCALAGIAHTRYHAAHPLAIPASTDMPIKKKS